MLRQGEDKWGWAELYVAAVRWAVEKFKWYILAGGLVVYLPLEELGRLFKLKDVCPKVRMLLLDLEIYQVTFRQGKGAWAYSQAILDNSKLQAGLGFEKMSLEDEGPLIKRIIGGRGKVKVLQA